jgi:hypothetical protein
VNLAGASLIGSNLAGVELQGSNLSGADLTRADLTKVDLRGARLVGATLYKANLNAALLGDANLSHAYMFKANLHEASLEGADLTRTTLTGANISAADLSNANLTQARLLYTSFAALDLSTTLGLDDVEHMGPSSVGIDTLFLSAGRISDAFLRGCGVPDALITYKNALAASPISFYSCFISYSSTDEGFAKRLDGRLRQAGLRVWFAPEDMKGGHKLHEQIDTAIRMHDKLLLVLSAQSMRSSWVQREIFRALQRERQEGRRVLFPIRLCSFMDLDAWECLDSDTGRDLAKEVRAYFIPDFTAWKDQDAFETSVKRLINDLRADPR